MRSRSHEAVPRQSTDSEGGFGTANEPTSRDASRSASGAHDKLRTRRHIVLRSWAPRGGRGIQRRHGARRVRERRSERAVEPESESESTSRPGTDRSPNYNPGYFRPAFCVWFSVYLVSWYCSIQFSARFCPHSLPARAPLSLLPYLPCAPRVGAPARNSP